MEILRVLEDRGMQYKETGTGQYVVKNCPFCPDNKGKEDNLWKLYINKENGLFLCHRCQTKGNGMQFSKQLGKSIRHDRRLNMVDQYLYQDESGCTYVRVSRLEDELGNKTFYQERLEGGMWSKGGARKPLQPFRFSEWEHEASIIIVEGEKCVISLRKMGFSATTFIGGSHGWKENYSNYFQNKKVILLPDQDEPGLKFMSSIASCLSQVVTSYKIVLLPDLQEKEDIYDWIRKGGNVKNFKEICEKTPENNLVCLQKKPTQDESIRSWGKPKDLPSLHAPVQDITSEIIPEALRAWVTDIAERMQVPLICVTVLALTVVGSLMGRKVRVYPKKEDDWYEVANLWSMIIMPSGRLKSPIINAVLKPLQELAEQAEAKYSTFSKESKLKCGISEAKIQAAKKEIQKIAGSRSQNRDEKLENAQKDLMELQEDSDGQVTSAKRYKIHDATVEKIGDLLKTNTNGLLLVRDELSGWLASLERTGHEGDREFFLESWNTKKIDSATLRMNGSIPKLL